MPRSLLCEKPYGSVLTPVQLTLKCYSQGNPAPATARGGSYTRRKRCYTARLMRPSGSCTKFDEGKCPKVPRGKSFLFVGLFGDLYFELEKWKE